MYHRKLHDFDASLITEVHFPGRNPQSINFGECFVWAYLCHQTFYRVELHSTFCHAFVKRDGKYFDSERPDGVLSWKELPTIVRERECDPAIRMSNDTFRHFWQGSAMQYRLPWEAIHLRAQIGLTSVAKELT
jgi:hypothetical protein